MSMMSAFSSDVAIDLGTANTCVFARGRGIVLNEPSIVAFNTSNGQIEAVGQEAHEMLGRTPPHIKPVRPHARRRHRGLRRRGKDAHVFRPQGAWPARLRAPPRLVIGVPPEITPVERRAVQGQRLPREGERGAPRRRVHGRRDRLGPAGHRAGRQHDRRHRRRHDRHRRHFDGRHGLRPLAARRRRRDGRSHHAVHAEGLQPPHRRAHRAADQVRGGLGRAARQAADDGSQGTAHVSKASRAS